MERKKLHLHANILVGIYVRKLPSGAWEKNPDAPSFGFLFSFLHPLMDMDAGPRLRPHTRIDIPDTSAVTPRLRNGPTIRY